ncbi:hypothetical protein GVN18_38090 [Pseudomonas sp. ODNR1LW]|nr:hypothetical protein [Pseudomonas sp. ODNR1LW]
MTATDKPRWRQMDTGDWAYERGEGEDAVRLGTVVFQDLGGRRIWYSVSTLQSHGPDEGSLTECKRRIERLWSV